MEGIPANIPQTGALNLYFCFISEDALTYPREQNLTLSNTVRVREYKTGISGVIWNHTNRRSWRGNGRECQSAE